MALELDEHFAAGLPESLLRPEPSTARQFVRFSDEVPSSVDEHVITEIRFGIFVDGKELVTMMCSPSKLRALVLGFLYIEGFIERLDDVDLLRICLEDRMAEVQLRNGDFEPPARKILTSGCTGGATFGKYLAELDRFKVNDGTPIRAAGVYELIRRLYQSASLYHLARGVHTSILADDEQVLVVAEDIGRHNTLDKIQGECLLRRIPTAGRVLVSSGRISSEMLLKAAIMGVTIVGSRTSPTELAVTLAERLNITVIGYIRPGSMNVYSHPWRVIGRS